MRKVSDYYSKKAKKEQYPARSVYKLQEIQQKHRLLRRGDSVLDLGCFPGSWSLYASEVVGPKGIVVGVDLQQAEKQPRAGSAEIHWICADITDQDMVRQVRELLAKLNAGKVAETPADSLGGTAVDCVRCRLRWGKETS